MTVEQRDTEEPGPAPHTGLERHVSAMRRQRRSYLAVLAALLLTTAVIVAVVWSRSEVMHAQLRTAATPAPTVLSGTLSEAPRQTWQSSDTTALGAPLAEGTVVTYSAHTVNGRDARTGAVAWSYTRTDRTVCSVAQVHDRTIALFERGGSCDEASAFASSTGARAWQRTFHNEGKNISGTVQLVSASDGVFVVGDAAIYYVRANEGYDFWSFRQPKGCHTRDAAFGTAGALIGQRCTDGDHLLLRDRYANDDDQNKNTKWRIDAGAIPIAADSFVAALDPASGELLSYDPGKGSVRARTTLQPRPSLTGPVLQSPTVTAELVWIGGTCYAIANSGASILWSATLATLPTVTPTAFGAGQVDLNTALVIVPAATGVDLLDGRTGAVRTRYRLAPPPPASRVVAFGTGFLLAGPSTVVYQ
ncbi:MAG: PQQ-binding-like beta-propeller repeat protein [Actinomycetota bacterium]